MNNKMLLTLGQLIGVALTLFGAYFTLESDGWPLVNVFFAVMFLGYCLFLVCATAAPNLISMAIAAIFTMILLVLAWLSTGSFGATHIGAGPYLVILFLISAWQLWKMDRQYKNSKKATPVVPPQNA